MYHQRYEAGVPVSPLNEVGTRRHRNSDRVQTGFGDFRQISLNLISDQIDTEAKGNILLKRWTQKSRLPMQGLKSHM